MSDSRPWAIVPVKRFELSKTRLAPVLSPEQRAALSEHMFADVVTSLSGHAALAGTIVVTADARVRQMAKRLGVHAIGERGRTLQAAIEQARVALRRAGGPSELIVSADLPQITPADISAIVAALGDHPLVLVRGRTDGGTNLLGCRPVGAIPALFGHDSFERHCRAGRARGIAAEQLDIGHLEVDVDRPEDLQYFLDLGTSTSTARYLAASGVNPCLERVAC